MKITFKCINRQYVVTVNGHPHIFTTSNDALEFIINARKEVA